MRLHSIGMGATVLAALTLAGCGHGNSPPPNTTVPITPLEQRNAELVAVLDRCPVSDPKPLPQTTDGAQFAPAFVAAPVIAALAPIAIDWGVSALRNYLERLESERSGAFMATGAGDLNGMQESCLVIARGKVGKVKEAIPSRGMLDNGALEKTKQVAQPDFYLEIKVKISPAAAKSDKPPAAAATSNKQKKSAPKAKESEAAQAPTPAASYNMELMPQYFQYARTVAKRGQDEEKSLALVLVARTSAAPEKADSAAAAKDAEAVFPINLGRLMPGSELKPEAFLGTSDMKRVAALQKMPQVMNFYAFVAENADENKALTLLTKAMERQNDGLQKALNKAVEDAMKSQQ